MHEDIVSVLTGMLNFLIEEIREMRKRTISPAEVWQLHALLHQSERRTRRLERIAKALASVDAQTPAELNLS